MGRSQEALRRLYAFIYIYIHPGINVPAEDYGWKSLMISRFQGHHWLYMQWQTHQGITLRFVEKDQRVLAQFSVLWFGSGKFEVFVSPPLPSFLLSSLFSLSSFLPFFPFPRGAPLGPSGHPPPHAHGSPYLCISAVAKPVLLV